MRRLLCVLLMLVLVAAGCGDDSGDGDGGGKREFVAKANAVCRELSSSLDAVERPDTAEEVARYGEVTARAFTKARADLKALDLPAGDEREGAEAYVGAYDELAPLIERLKTTSAQVLAAVRARDETQGRNAAGRLQGAGLDLQRQGSKADRLAADYGLESCDGDG